jgi:lipopolysaccharide biosynthesis glycosyltransferase
MQEINIVLCADWNIHRGVVVLCNSIAKYNARHLQHLRIYLVTDGEAERVRYTELLAKTTAEQQLSLSVIAFTDPSFLQQNIRIMGSAYHQSHLKNIMNFARFYIAQVLPKTVDWVIYLDADMIVQGDLDELLTTAQEECVKQNTPPFAAVPISKENGFNAGMFVTSLRYWRSGNVLKIAQTCMIRHKQSKNGLFELGSQPVLNHVFPKYAELSDEWNRMHLGWASNLTPAYVQSGKILHWNGEHKPWDTNGFYKDIWEPFDTYGNDNSQR